jgi:hypothetical protein
VARLDEKDELYDLRSDPAETVNRIEDRRWRCACPIAGRMMRFTLKTADVVPPADDECAYMRARDER